MKMEADLKVNFPMAKPSGILGRPGKKAWVIAVDMGYGHRRAAYPLRGISFNRTIINANKYEGILAKDEKFWKKARSFYEFVSRFRKVPIVGLAFFLFFDAFQKIVGYYPKRDLSKANFSGRLIFSSIKRGWGRDLIEKLSKDPLPIVSTFFTPAFMAEHFKYPGDIYCVICDADIARAWVPLHPKKSRICYLAPNTWARDRLKLYGVKTENIILTGYPLPKENVGRDLEIVKKDLGYRLLNLDPTGAYCKLYKPLIRQYLGNLPQLPNHPLTVLFSIGGAGAQKEIASAILHALKLKTKQQKLKFIISVGTRKEHNDYFTRQIKKLKLGGGAEVLYATTMEEYFEKFNQALRTTDILMTKPSELSFYAGLGLPIIIQPSIGSQEDFNRRWLEHIGAGTAQENPKYTEEWLFDMLESGDLAEMAMQGFVEVEKMGAYNIERIIRG